MSACDGVIMPSLLIPPYLHTTLIPYVCMYVCMSGSVSHGEERGADNTGEIRYLVFFAYLHGDGVEDCSMISDCSDLESNFFLSF